MKKAITLLAATISFTVSANQSLRDDAILVDDIEYKLAAGFKADDVVYKLPAANYTLNEETTRGVGLTQYQPYAAVEGRGRESDFAYETASGSGDIFRTGGDMFHDVMVEVPEGNEFTFVRVWGIDNNAGEDLNFFVFERCLPEFGSGPIVSTTLATVTSSGSGGEFSTFVAMPADTIIDNTGCVYTIRTRFDVSDNTLRLFKVRAQSEPSL